MPAKFIPSDTERKTVREMAGCGTPQADICRVIGISEPTLRRAFRVELDTAAAEANAAVAKSLFRMATDPARPNVAAAIFWLKTRAGWKETPASEPQSNDLDVRSMSDEELEAKLQELGCTFRRKAAADSEFSRDLRAVCGPSGNINS